MKTSYEIAADREFLNLAVNAFIGMMSGVRFEEVFEEVATTKKSHSKLYNFTTQDIASACILTIMDLTEGDMETVRDVGGILTRLKNVQKEEFKKGPVL